MNEAAFDPGSFRDRTARVFTHQGQIYRGLSDAATRDWQALAATRFYRRAVLEGTLCQTEVVQPAHLPPEAGAEWATILKHERVPFVSYPYEWPFGMLKDAALLQLELLLAALDEGMTLKDASPFNVQWVGSQPVFVDIASFQVRQEGEPWVGYRQFCQLFLYPLLLSAYRGVPFHPWLRGSLDGIDADTCRRLMRLRDYARGGVLTHVYLQAKADSAAPRAGNVRAELRAAGFTSGMVASNARRLRTLIQDLVWPSDSSPWSGYATELPYEPGDARSKQQFVREVVSARAWNLAWDLGCNTGTFSRIAGERARTVVALDADHLVVERFYQELKAEKNRTIVPLVADMADPSPNLGWRNLERRQLIDRGRPDIVLCLALVHHLVIGRNVPLPELLEWLRELGGDLVIEFVTREDPMVVALLRNKDDQYDDYDRQVFERELAARFTVARSLALKSGTRILYHARGRA
jgi:SAM-dependent methyltransferase